MVTWFSMGLGLPTCGAACCLPDGLVFGGKSQDDSLNGGKRNGMMVNGMMASPLNLSVGVTDEVEVHSEQKHNMIVFRNDRAPEGKSRDRAHPDSTYFDDDRATTRTSSIFTSTQSADSCSMLNDLDFLTDPEWQTMPQPTRSELEEGLIKEAETVSQDKAYPVALRSLWHNCPEALEIALRRVEGLPLSEVQARDKRFMWQKLEFTLIRQRFVALCIEFRGSGPQSETSTATLRAGVAEIEERLRKLLAEQSDEQVTQLPGLIQKRDTLMLQARMRDISAKLLSGGGA